MNSKTTAAGLADCVSPLGEEGRRAVCRYWDQVIREEYVRPALWLSRPAPFVEEARRERRQARRALARIAAAGRRGTAAVVALPTAAPTVLAGEAA